MLISTFKNKGLLLMVSVLMVLSIVLSACSSNEPEQTPKETQPAAEESSAPAPTAAAEQPKEIKEVEMVVFTPPSLGAFLQPVIEEFEFDKKNGVDIKFVERPPSAYNTEFASGQFKLGGSAAPLSEGLRMDRGVKVSYLFNIFDFWGAAVTANPEIKTLKDIEGKTLAAAKSTTNFAMFQYFAIKAGVDISTFKVQNAETSALISFAEADRADVVQLWQPAYEILTQKNPNKFHQIDLGLDKWKEYTGTSSMPYLGVAAHQDWIEANKDVLPGIYKTYVDAAEWMNANPAKAAELIASKIKGADAKIMQSLIENDGMKLNVKPSSELTEDLRAIFKAGVESGYLANVPDESIIYTGNLK